MEEQAELNIGIGTEEKTSVSLKPAKVKIVSAKVEPTTKSKKVVFEVKHPDKEETIHISSVSFLDNKEVKTVGTWFNLDSVGQIQKGSALAILLTKLEAPTIMSSVGKEIDTELDGNYLVFKAY